MQYKRVLLKLSGEALMGDRQYGIDPKRLKEYAKEIKEVTDKGIEQAVLLQKQFPKSLVISTRETTNESVSKVDSISAYLATNFSKLDGICFETC